MDKINENNNGLRFLQLIGFYIILALPILLIPPYFFPADWGKAIVFRSILSILLFTFAYQFLYKKAGFPIKRLLNNKIVRALGALFFIYLLASIFSVDPLFSFWGSPYRSGGFVNFAFYFIFAFAIFVFFKNRKDWEKAWIFSISIGALVSLLAIFQYYGLFNITIAGQPASTLGNPILLAIYLLLLSFPTLSFAINEPLDSSEDKIRKIFYIASLLIFLFAILISGTRAVYLGIFVGVLFFLLAYPKKLKKIKIGIAIFLILVFGIILYANIHPQLPEVLQNRATQGLIGQLSIKKALNDGRFGEWKIAVKEVIDRPILGWGPENFSVGFDKNYDPMTTSSPWWDRAHNILLETGADAGILGIVAYLALFVVLFWQLQKTKHKSEDVNTKIVINGIEATLLGYLAANFFSFDSSTTYLILFLIVAYILHLTSTEPAEINPKKPSGIYIKPWIKSVVIFVLFCMLVIFLWQYNFVPFQINAEINKANTLADQKLCDKAFSTLDNVLPQHSFLDSYFILQYVEAEKTCSAFYPGNNLAYTQKGIALLNEAIKIQPLFTRFWLFLGDLTTTLADNENNASAKNNLLQQAGDYFNKGLQLAPNHQELFTGEADLKIVAGDYKSAEDYSQKCIVLNPSLGDCYFYLGLAQIYLKDNIDAKKNIQTAGDKGYAINSEQNLIQIANAYGSFPDYQNLAPIFEKLILINQTNIQYHSYLSLIYTKLGEYDKAKQEENIVSQLSPK